MYKRNYKLYNLYHNYENIELDYLVNNININIFKILDVLTNSKIIICLLLNLTIERINIELSSETSYLLLTELERKYKYNLNYNFDSLIKQVNYKNELIYLYIVEKKTLLFNCSYFNIDLSFLFGLNENLKLFKKYKNSIYFLDNKMQWIFLGKKGINGDYYMDEYHIIELKNNIFEIVNYNCCLNNKIYIEKINYKYYNRINLFNQRLYLIFGDIKLII